jgi:hypothetical protein
VSVNGELPESGTSESDITQEKSVKEEPAVLDFQTQAAPPLVDLRLEDVDFCPSGLAKTDQPLLWDTDASDSFQIGHLPDLMVGDLGNFAEPWMP